MPAANVPCTYPRNSSLQRMMPIRSPYHFWAGGIGVIAVGTAKLISKRTMHTQHKSMRPTNYASLCSQASAQHLQPVPFQESIITLSSNNHWSQIQASMDPTDHSSKANQSLMTVCARVCCCRDSAVTPRCSCKRAMDFGSGTCNLPYFFAH